MGRGKRSIPDPHDQSQLCVWGPRRIKQQAAHTGWTCIFTRCLYYYLYPWLLLGFCILPHHGCVWSQLRQTKCRTLDCIYPTLPSGDGWAQKHGGPPRWNSARMRDKVHWDQRVRDSPTPGHPDTAGDHGNLGMERACRLREWALAEGRGTLA